MRDATRRLGAQRTRENAATLRAALFSYADARPDETLSALLSRIESDRTALRASLRMAERATFVEDANLQGAIDDLLDAAGRMTGFRA